MEDEKETSGNPSEQAVSLRDYVARFPQEAQAGPEFDQREEFWINVSRKLRQDAEQGKITLPQFDSLIGGLIAAKEWNEEQDFLTGIGNRRAYEKHINERLSESRRHALTLTLVGLDLDNFKTLNDERGHPVGNKFLIKLGEIIRGHKRVEDFAARVGGDEILIILPRTTVKEAAVFIARLEDQIQGMITEDFEFVGLTRPLGVSFGFAAWDGEESSEALEKRVDDLLYKAKKVKKHG